MHFVVSWDLRAQGSRWAEINAAMLEGLRGRSWIRMLSTFYILEIESDQDWPVIQESLLSVAQIYSGEVNFLMSPVYDFDSDYFVYQMPDGDYYKT